MIIILVIISIALILIDQIIKYWVVVELMPVRVMDFIKFGDFQVLGLRYAQNDGAAFSSFSGARYFLIIFNIVIMIALIIFTFRMGNKNKLLLVSVMMVVSGGIGNIIDRIRLGYVIDYLEVRFFDFAIFNFADICVVIGACLLILYILMSEVKEKKASKSDE